MIRRGRRISHISHEQHGQLVSWIPSPLYSVLHFTYPHQNVFSSRRIHTVHWSRHDLRSCLVLIVHSSSLEKKWNCVISELSTNHYIVLHIILHNTEKLIVVLKDSTLIHEINLKISAPLIPTKSRFDFSHLHHTTVWIIPWNRHHPSPSKFFTPHHSALSSCLSRRCGTSAIVIAWFQNLWISKTKL